MKSFENLKKMKNYKMREFTIHVREILKLLSIMFFCIFLLLYILLLYFFIKRNYKIYIQIHCFIVMWVFVVDMLQ